MAVGIEPVKETKKGETLTYFVSDQVTPVVAPAKDIESYRIVKGDTTGTNAKPITYATDATESYTGITTHGANLEQQISVQRSGVAIVQSGGAIPFQSPVKAGALGKAVVAVAGDLALGLANQIADGADEFIGIEIDQHTVA